MVVHTTFTGSFFHVTGEHIRDAFDKGHTLLISITVLQNILILNVRGNDTYEKNYHNSHVVIVVQNKKQQ